MTDEVDADAALARLLLRDVPVLWDTTFESLAQGHFNEDPDILHQDEGKHSHIQQEQTQQE